MCWEALVLSNFFSLLSLIDNKADWKQYNFCTFFGLWFKIITRNITAVVHDTYFPILFPKVLLSLCMEKKSMAYVRNDMTIKCSKQHGNYIRGIIIVWPFWRHTYYVNATWNWSYFTSHFPPLNVAAKKCDFFLMPEFFPEISFLIYLSWLIFQIVS